MTASRIATVVAIIAGTVFTLAATLSFYANTQFGSIAARFENDDWEFWAFTVWEPLQPFLWVTGIAFVAAVLIAIVTRRSATPRAETPKPARVPW